MQACQLQSSPSKGLRVRQRCAPLGVETARLSLSMLPAFNQGWREIKGEFSTEKGALMFCESLGIIPNFYSSKSRPLFKNAKHQTPSRVTKTDKNEHLSRQNPESRTLHGFHSEIYFAINRAHIVKSFSCRQIPISKLKRSTQQLSPTIIFLGMGLFIVVTAPEKEGISTASTPGESDRPLIAWLDLQLTNFYNELGVEDFEVLLAIKITKS